MIDEWQVAPNLWDAVRYEVDSRGQTGQFILTGSAVPADTDKMIHSGTGRISRLRMRPMTLSESGDCSKQVSLEQMFAGGPDLGEAKATTLEQIGLSIMPWWFAAEFAAKPARFLVVMSRLSRVGSTNRYVSCRWYPT